MTKLSLTGGSGLSMRDILDCPALFKNKKDGWRRIYTPIYFLEGDVFHKSAYKVIKNEPLKPITDEMKIAIGEYKKGEFILGSGIWHNEEKNEKIMIENEKATYGEKSTITEGEQMVKRHAVMIDEVKKQKKLKRFKGVKEIERYIEIPVLVDPRNGNPDDTAKLIQDSGLIFCGRIDLDRGADLDDLKTAKGVPAMTDNEFDIIVNGGFLERKGIYDAYTDSQLHTYAYFKTIHDGTLVEHVTFHVFTKNITKCNYYPIQGTVNTGDYIHVFEMAKEAGMRYLDCEKHGYPKTGYAGGCRDKFNQRCPFHPLCFPEKYSDLKKACEGIHKI